MKKYVKKKRYFETGKLTDWVAYLFFYTVIFVIILAVVMHATMNTLHK